MTGEDAPPRVENRHTSLAALLQLKNENPSYEAYYEYHRLCATHGNSVDPWVSISLYVRSSSLKLSRAAGEVDLVPLVELLLGNSATFVKELHLTSLKISAVSALLLSTFLRQNSSVEHLNLSRTYLGDDGVELVVEGLKKNNAIKCLDLSSNRVHGRGALALATALRDGIAPNLTTLHITNNTMGQAGCDILIRTCVSREVILHYGGNHVVSEVFNSITHGLALIVAIVGTAIMTNSASRLEWRLRASVSVFCFSLCFLFLSSTLYHSFFRTAFTKEIFRTMDHCSIFLLIAGTYSPFILKYVWTSENSSLIFGPLMFVLVWACGIAGVFLSVRKNKKERNSQKARVVLAVCMGWLALLSVKLLLQRMPTPAILLTLFGGIAYTAGVPLYLRGREVALYHVYWHVAVMLGSFLHFVVIYMYVVNG